MLIQVLMQVLVTRLAIGRKGQGAKNRPNTENK